MRFNFGALLKMPGVCVGIDRLQRSPLVAAAAGGRIFGNWDELWILG